MRFWEKVDQSLGLGPRGDCWLWRGGRRGSRVSKQSTTFYGGFRYQGKVRLAHCVVWLLVEGNIPKGKNVLHSCDVPACVRPSHLFLGDQSDNAKDCWKKGRGYVPKSPARGEDSGVSKLTEDKVRWIRHYRARGYSLRKLAKMYRVSAPNIRSICLRRTWQHV